MEVIDIHTHMMGATWVDAITSHKNYGSAEFNGKKMIALAGKPYIPIEDEMLDYEKRIRDMNVSSKARIGFKRRMHGVMREVQKERLLTLDDLGDVFFGFNCISHVTLKIVQDSIKKNEKVFPKIKNYSKIEEKMSKVNNTELKSSLNNFLKAFNERNK